MPVSKKRKKKKSSSKRGRGNTQVKEIGGVKIIRKGNTVYTRNKRSAKEHEQFLNDIKQGLPFISNAIKEKTSGAIQIFRRYDNIELLGALSVNHLSDQMGEEDGGAGEVILEYGMSLSSAIREGNSLPFPSSTVLDELINTLSDIKFLYGQMYTFESLATPEEGDNADEGLTRIKLNAVIESLSVRGVGYYQHVEEIFLGLFSQHDKFLVDNYGFTAHELITTLHELESSWAIRQETKIGPHPLLIRRFMDWTMEKRIFPPVPSLENVKKFQLENPDVLIDERGFKTFRINEIGDYDALFKIRYKNEVQQKVVEALSIEFGENHDFLDGKVPGHMLGKTKIHQTPFLKKRNGDSYLFSYALPSRHFLKIGQSLIEKADPKYYNKYYLGNAQQICRDNFIERKVEEIFRSFLPEVEFYPNAKYPLKSELPNKKDEFTELDLLGIGNNDTYLIEIKAGELNEAAKRGAVESLVNGIKKNVGKGISQSERAAAFIREEEAPVFKINHNKATITVDKTKKIHRILVTLDSFLGLLTMINTLESASVVEKKDDFPWIIHIYDLMVFAEIISSEQDFTDYLEKRIPLNNWKAFTTHDELNLLGCFLEDDLIFKKQVRHLDSFTLGHYLHDIDAYFYKKQTGFKPVIPTRKKKK